MKKQKKGKTKRTNPIARALNRVTKPVTMVDKKKLMSKLNCRNKTKLGVSFKSQQNTEVQIAY